MDLHSIIQDILTRKEGVVIPGLGSLVSRYRSAKIDTGKNVIHPPKKEIRFNPSVTTDSDQILAKYIASEENIPLSKAQTLIQTFVQNIRNGLEENGKFTLKGIGTLKKAETRIELIPEEDPALNLGFAEIQAEPFEVEKIRETQKKIIPGQPPPTRKSGRKTIGLIIASTFLLIIIGGAYYIGFFDYLAYKIKNQEIFQNINLTETQPNSREEPPEPPEDTALDTASMPPEIKQALNRMTDKKRALMYKQPEDNKIYHIIAGSFRIRSNAREYQNQLADKGYTSEILENDSLYRVSVNSFDKKEDALVNLYRMRDNGKLKSIWLLAVQKTDR